MPSGLRKSGVYGAKAREWGYRGLIPPAVESPIAAPSMGVSFAFLSAAEAVREARDPLPWQR